MNKRWLRQDRKKQRGFSLPELLISTTILLAILAIVLNYMTQTWQTHDYTNAHAYLKTQAQNGLIRISRGVNQAKMIMGNDTAGLNYRNRLDLTNAPPSIADSTLPTLRTTGSLAPEKNCTDFPTNYFRANAVGNSFLYAQNVGSFTDFSTGANYKIDLFEFRYLYSSDNSHLPENERYYLNLKSGRLPSQTMVEWRSVRFASFEQLSALLNATADAGERGTIKADLAAAGIEYTWERTQTNLNNAFREVTSGGNSANMNTMGGGFDIPASRTYNALLLTNSTESIYSIAYNQNDGVNTGSNFVKSRMSVPHFYSETVASCPATAVETIPANTSTPAVSAGNFPRGFEVMVAGPGSGRAVLMRVSLYAKTSRNLVEHAHMFTTYARDL